METKKSFAGYSRRRKTRWTVRLVEIVARNVVRIGGIGTIVAIIMVGVFLVYVSMRLFSPASISPPSVIKLPTKNERVLREGVDDYQLLGWTLYADGTLTVARLDNGNVLQERKLFPGQLLTACSAPSREEEMAFGFNDGKVRIGRIGFVRQYVAEVSLPEKLRKLAPGEIAELEAGTLTCQPDGKFRSQTFVAEIEEPLKNDNSSGVVKLDLSVRDSGFVLSVLTVDGNLRTSAITKKKDELLDKTTFEVEEGKLHLPDAEKVPPSHVLVSGVGDNVFVTWAKGRTLRISTQNIETPRVVEEFNLLGEEDVVLTALQFMIGKTTLLAGDTTGRVRAWFRTSKPDAKTGDKAVMVAAHEFPATGSEVTSLAVSSRTRIAAAGDLSGRVRLFDVTSEKMLGEIHTPKGEPIRNLLLAPKDDGVIVRTPDSVLLYKMDPKHPEITLSSLTRPVWYEGYDKPAHVWQSSSGNDEFEPKFGMWPLIFGTLKATFYSLLMGVPLALLAAIYTSEFLSRPAKNIIKPTIESMASLPSVVLGFLAALVVAPFVDHWLAAVLAGFLTVPATVVIGAYVWQLLPEKIELGLARYRVVLLLILLVIGLMLATLIGPLLEKLLFRGDIKTWVNKSEGSGSATPGWIIILLPPSLLITLLFVGRSVNPWLRGKTRGFSRWQHALVDFGKFITAAAVTLALASLCGLLLTELGFDPRGTFVGTYVQRNALVVGFMMGFAIIPIIFTIAEDALSAVPEHLRSASLACGATQWQTTLRIIVPTAMSGLFSAVMIGLGRAVGETMIVLMAAGNAPVLDWNIFNGFRTMSANIAVELPEAVRDSTHFRTLFLSAVVLFAITFALNTVAEVVRLRFRKRAYQL